MVLSDAYAVVWHDLECGCYSADLPLWRELAMRAATETEAQPLLDIGAGTGRVALDLAARGHNVTALDLEEQLLSALRERAATAETPVETACADARTFALSRRDFAVCLAPMQTIQLLGGAARRIAFLRQAHAHLRPGGLLACAIVTEIEPFDCAAGDSGPSAEAAEMDGRRYISRAVSVQVADSSISIERERSIRGDVPAGQATDERNIVELDRLSATQLRREGHEAGFVSAGTRSIPATQEHVGSEVVLLRA
jgi:SAM-dependent methyltransferase